MSMRYPFGRPAAVLVLSLVLRATAGSWYISPGGSNTNNGLTETTAFADLDHVQSVVKPGDTVWVLDGEYTNLWTTYLETSGTEDKWIVYRAKNRHGALVRCTNTGHYQDGIEVTGSYIVVDGLRITTSDEGHGIEIKYSHHLKVCNCEIYQCGGSGISIWIPISVPGDTTPGARIVIRNNICFANECTVTWSTFTDGNGIILDCFGDEWARNYPHDWPDASLRGQPIPAYTHGAIVEGNICFDNGGRGIHVLNSDNVVVRFNTLYKNLRAAIRFGFGRPRRGGLWPSSVKSHH